MLKNCAQFVNDNGTVVGLIRGVINSRLDAITTPGHKAAVYARLGDFVPVSAPIFCTPSETTLTGAKTGLSTLSTDLTITTTSYINQFRLRRA
jgi:hypothetical protein